MKPYFLFLLLVMLMPCIGVAQIAIPKGPKPDETINTGGILKDNNGDFPFILNVTQKNRYGNEWKSWATPLVKMNKACDTLEMSPMGGIVKVIKIGPNYYKVTRSGVEYQLQFAYREPVVY